MITRPRALSFVKLPNNKRAVRQDEVPADYAGVPIVEHGQEISGLRQFSEWPNSKLTT